MIHDIMRQADLIRKRERVRYFLTEDSDDFQEHTVVHGNRMRCIPNCLKGF